MKVLETHCKEILKLKGMKRVRMLASLRKYLHRATLTEQLEQVMNMTDMTHFKVLWEAGLDRFMQDAVQRRQLELEVRRRE